MQLSGRILSNRTWVGDFVLAYPSEERALLVAILAAATLGLVVKRALEALLGLQLQRV
jgi:hypothetical protein